MTLLVSNAALFVGLGLDGSTLEHHVGITFQAVLEFMLLGCVAGLGVMSCTATCGLSANNLIGAY